MRTKILLLLLLLSSLTHAQTINTVSNPSAPGLFAWSGTGALSGYAGDPVILNNQLITQYNPTGISDPSVAGFTLQLAVYDGTNYQLINNPDNGPGVYYQGPQIIFNNKMFFIYLNISGTQQLASFDGLSISLYTNPDAGLGYIGSPRIYNNELYGAYNNASGIIQFAKFNGAGLSLIPNPDNSLGGFNYNYAAVLNNKLVARYVTDAGPKQLATFNGTSWTILPNPDNTTRGVYPDFPIIYHDKIYWRYYSASNQYQCLLYDGVNNPSLIANPEDASVNGGGVNGFPVISQDTLFFQYYNALNIYQLAKCNGTTLTLVPNPDNSPYGYYWKPAVYNNQLYILYQAADNIRHLAEYQPASNNIFIYPNPDAGIGYWDYPQVFNNKLYMMYSDASSIFRLSYFDNSSSIHLVANPSGVYNSSGYNGYMGSPVIFNNLFYMQFGSVPYAYAGNLASFNGVILPVSLLNFKGIVKDNKGLLIWSTANETNNKGFELEKSGDGAHFNAIAFIYGKGNSPAGNNYNFTDEKLLNGTNYYRLKQIDLDGKFTYSGIVKLDYSGFNWAIIDNSATGNAKLDLQLDKQANVSVQIISVNGNIIKTINKGNLAQGNYLIPLALNNVSNGTYIVRLMVDDKIYTDTIIQ